MNNSNTNILKKQYDFIVIGSGISGLCSAALLSKRGFKVLVLEKHFKAGGFTHTFKRQGYEWDVGIHYIGDVHRPYSLSGALFRYISEGRLQWNKMGDNYDKIVFPDKEYNFFSPKERFINDLKNHFPEEKKAIDQYMDLLDDVAKAGKAFYAAKAAPKLVYKLTYSITSKPFIKLASQTTMQVLSSLTTNKKLIGVLCGQWGDYGLPPSQSSFVMHAMVARHYLDGANYPIGGSSSIAASIVPTIEKSGGHVVVSAGVKKIICEGKRAVGVMLENGTEIAANKIISSCGVTNTFERLLSDQSIKEYDQIKKVSISGGHLCLHIGINRSHMKLNLTDTNIWLYPGYDHDKNVLNHSQSMKSDFPLIYFSFPSVKDPKWHQNHPDKTTIELITMSRYEWFEKWRQKPWKKRGEEYESIKEALSIRLLDKMYEHLPQLKGEVDYYELSTPLSTRDMSHYKRGELYGLNHTPSRFNQKNLTPRTGIKNLYLTGQDIVSVGLAGALSSGALTVSAILRKNILKDLRI